MSTELKSEEKLAKQFHETYERLAPDFGYETRKDSAVAWENVPEKNKNLMIAVCKEILNARAPVSGLREKVEALKEFITVILDDTKVGDEIGVTTMQLLWDIRDTVNSLLSSEPDVLAGVECKHQWKDVDDEIGGNRTTVHCNICKIYGERNDETGHIHFPIS